MIALTMFGVSFGFAWSISATVPETIGEAMLVPVRLRYGFLPSSDHSDPLSRYCALVVKKRLPGADSETMPVPGATTSGFAMKSIAVGPREL